MQLAVAHALALDWFNSRAATTVNWPAPQNGIFLANKAKGIHKPAGWQYALSIRLTLDGPYVDLHQKLDHGAWQLEYNQEGDDPAYFTNRALLACLRDEVPVGVLKQTRSKPTSEYLVLGLGDVVGFVNGKFTIKSHSEGEARALPISPFLQEFDFSDKEDRRTFRHTRIASRNGQPLFRSQLDAAYEGRCAVSGCQVPQALEAAHILCYRGTHTNHVRNGILLRADIHALFDAGLISIASNYRITVSPVLSGTEYFRFQAKQIRLPLDRSCWPDPGALERRLSEEAKDKTTEMSMRS